MTSTSTEFQRWYDGLPEAEQRLLRGYGEQMVAIGKQMAAVAPEKPNALTALGAAILARLKQPSTYAGGGILAILAARYLPGVSLQQLAEYGGMAAAALSIVLNEGSHAAE